MKKGRVVYQDGAFRRANTAEAAAGNEKSSPTGSGTEIYLEAGPSALESKTGVAHTLAKSIPSISDMRPVAALTGREMSGNGKKASERIADFFNRIGNSVERSGFGKVIFGEYGVGGMLNHRPLNRAKMVSLEAVPEVIRSGKLIAQSDNWKDRGYSSYVFAAPVTIAGEQVYVAAVVDKRPDNKFYLNECVDSEGNFVRIKEKPSDNTKSGVTVQDGVTAVPEGSTGSVAQNTTEVKSAENGAEETQEATETKGEETTRGESEKPRELTQEQREEIKTKFLNYLLRGNATEEEINERLLQIRNKGAQESAGNILAQAMESGEIVERDGKYYKSDARKQAEQDFAREMELREAGVHGDTTWMKKADADYLGQLAKAGNVSIEVVDTLGQAQGAYDPKTGRIQIAKDMEDPVGFVTQHELTHRMKQNSPEKWSEFLNYVQEQYGERWNDTVEQTRQRYAESGIELTAEEAAEEVAADFAGSMDEKAIRRLTQENRSLTQKILDAIRSLIRKLKGGENQKLYEMEKLWASALKEGNKNTAQEGGVRYSIKRTSEMTLAEQLKMYYDGKMASSDAFCFGETPAALKKAGFDALPLAMTTSNFRKSTKEKHNIPRRVLKNLMDHMAEPLFSFGNGDRVGVVLDDIDGDGHKLLAGLERGTEMDRMPVNVINSLYGIEHPAEWIKNQISSGNEFVLYDEKRANAFLQTYGYLASVGDGIRSTEESIAQNGTEVKAESSNGKKFSLKSPVEETRDLLALHNLDENSLLGGLELGGLPMPSIAIAKAKEGHSKYGPISLVFNKDTIDPQADSRNKVYGGDAWTPTSPKVEYPVDGRRLVEIENELNTMAGSATVADGIFKNSAALRSLGVDTTTSGKSAAAVAEELARTDTARAAYLAEQGKTLAPVKKEKVWGKFGNDTLRKVIDRLGAQELAAIEARLETGESVESALGESAEAIRDVLRGYYREAGEPTLQRAAAKHGWSAEEIGNKREARIASSMENVTPYTLEDVIHNAWNMYEDGGATAGETDYYATRDALRKSVDDNAVKEWVSKKIEGLLGEAGVYNGKERYTPSGNLRSFDKLHYTYTLENIVKAMKETQKERGEGTWGATARALQSVAAPEYRSVQEIKADRERLGLAEGTEYDAKAQAIDEQIGSIITRIKRENKARSDNPLIDSDIIGEVLMDAAKGKKTVDAITRAFSREGYKIGSQTAQDIQAVYKAAAEMPTAYFEAKPQRAVGFDEVLAAVIPDDSSEKLRSALAGKDVNVITYKSGDETDRLAKINSVDDAKFSLKGSKAMQDELYRLTKQNERMEQELDALRETVRTGKQSSTDRKSTEKAARDMARKYDSTVNRGELTEQLLKLYDGMAQGDLSRKEMRQQARDIADSVIDAAEVNTNPMYEEYANLRKGLRTEKVTLPEEYRKDIQNGYNEVRKRAMGKVLMGNDGTPVDVQYETLHDRYGELFPDDIMNPAGQLQRMVDVAESLQKVMGNPFQGLEGEDIRQGLANDILEQFFDIATTQGAKLQKMQREWEKQREKDRKALTMQMLRLYDGMAVDVPVFPCFVRVFLVLTGFS